MDFIELIEDYEDLIDLRQAKYEDRGAKGVSVEQLLKEISEENNPNLQYD